MTAKVIEAWLIHKQWSGDSSARIHLLTKEFGLISCLYHGARKPKKQALLQAFTPLWVGVKERYGHYYVQGMECLSPTLSLQGHALFSALYVNELICYSLKPLCVEPELFQTYVYTLNHLAVSTDRPFIERLLRRFEWSLLKACGHHFSFLYEANTGELIHVDSYYRFSAGEGFIAAKEGIHGSYLLALADDDLQSSELLKTAKLIMRQAIDHLLSGREIKARALYTQSLS